MACESKKEDQLVAAEVEAAAFDESNATKAYSIRRNAGISAAGLTGFLSRVPSGFVVDKLRQVGCYARMHVLRFDRSLTIHADDQQVS